MPTRISTPSTRLLSSLLSPLAPSTSPYTCTTCLLHHHQRSLHRKRTLPIPSPTPFVPNAPTFLSLIGRSLSKHASKFPDWPSLFTLSSEELKDLGIEPPRTRRYLLRWRDKFRKGEFGIGGDLKYVSDDGTAELRVLEVPTLPPAESTHTSPQPQGGQEQEEVQPYVSATRTPGTTALILNTPPNTTSYESLLEPGESSSTLRKPQGFKLLNGHTISAPYIKYSAGSNYSVATLRPEEGMWEHRRGHKVDGGERRKAEVRFKRRVAERKAAAR